MTAKATVATRTKWVVDSFLVKPNQVFRPTSFCELISYTLVKDKTVRCRLAAHSTECLGDIP